LPSRMLRTENSARNPIPIAIIVAPPLRGRRGPNICPALNCGFDNQLVPEYLTDRDSSIEVPNISVSDAR
jgi:hypothetical protein